jgi:hypothetical protein
VRSFSIPYAGQNIMAVQIQMEKSISYKRQASSAIKKTQLNNRIKK